MKCYLITGGCGFIGTNFIRHVLSMKPDWRIVNLDALTYAGNPANLADMALQYPDRYRFVHGDIRDATILRQIFSEEVFNGVVHFAAESHVDRSILGPDAFVDTNVVGTFRLLQASLDYWKSIGNSKEFIFFHVSTDEVYGSLGKEGYFTEKTPYDPSSPYSASKASADHFVNSYHRTYGLPVLITNCSNNYGPYQFPEKLIPLMILNILEEKPLPVYGTGNNIRDWLYVVDHCDAIIKVIEHGKYGETYNIGGSAERKNIEIVHMLCDILDERLDRVTAKSSRRLIKFVPDRHGHDWRYAIDASKIKRELHWQPTYNFDTALISTVGWYLENSEWIESVRSGEYRKWIEINYGKRR